MQTFYRRFCRSTSPPPDPLPMAPGGDDAEFDDLLGGGLLSNFTPAGVIEELAQSLGVDEPGSSSLGRPVQGLDRLLNIPDAESSDEESDSESAAATGVGPEPMLLPVRLPNGRGQMLNSSTPLARRRPGPPPARKVVREPTGVPRPCGTSSYQASYRDNYSGSFTTIGAAKATYEAA
eukprot:3521563-Prymnesium_polylepis.1